MKKRIALLRGINVGGRRKILMADLKVLLSNHLGFKNVQTYIQSGNVIFDSDTHETDVILANKIQQCIFKKYEFEVPTIVRRVHEFEKLVAANPFLQEADINQLFVTFLSGVPTAENLENINKVAAKSDQFVIVDNHVFGYCSGKYSESKLTNKFFESKLKTAATTRNWKTVLKLVALANLNV